jgi:YidC/Oxa1 family membrane protein insertase
MEALRLASADMKQLYKAADIKISRLFLPLLVQGPLGFGTWRLLNGMAALPVPGMDEGGLLWVKDLTVSDPYLILPMVTGLAFFWTFKVCKLALWVQSLRLSIYR